MSTATLTIDLDAIVANWRALDAMTGCETGAAVKADAYGLGAAPVARALAAAGARQFFVATAEEGAALRGALGDGPAIHVLSGHMAGDARLLGGAALTPMLCSLDQMIRHVEALPGAPFGIQLNTGMNRLGMKPAEWAAVREIALSQNPVLVMSHLACADTPGHPMNERQLAAFCEMTDGIAAPRSLAGTGGILLGGAFHFELTRPGIGLYGGLPFVDARPVAALEVPVVQCHDLAAGETVGYGNSFTAGSPSRIATIGVGYGDGLHRAMAAGGHVYAGDVKCPLAGRISMDLTGVDITGLAHDPDSVELLGRHLSIDTLAGYAGTIGYEILTSLGVRHARRHIGG